MVAACINGDEAPPVNGASALSVGECPGLPIAAFIEDALVNLAALDSSDPDAIDVLLDIIGLGTSAEGIDDLVNAVRSGTLDTALWPSLIDLSPADAERTIAAAIIEIDPDFQLHCGLLRRFSEGPARTVTDLALIVNQSHGFPVTDEEMLSQPFERKSLKWEIATALDRVQGIRPPGGRHGVNASPDTEVESPLIQLLAAFRGAHNAFFGRERPWAHRPFGRPQAAFDKLVYSLGAERTDAGFIGPSGGELYGSGELGGVILTIPPGALEEEIFVEIHQETTGPMPPYGQVPVGPMVELLPDGLDLNGTASLRLPFYRDLHRVLRTDEAATFVARYGESTGEWEAMESVFEEPNVVVVSLSGFSLYQAMVEASTLFAVESVHSDPDGILATATAGPGSALYVTRTAREEELRWTEECETGVVEPTVVQDVVRLSFPEGGVLIPWAPVPKGKARSVSSLRSVGQGFEVIITANGDWDFGTIDGRLVMSEGLVYRVRGWAPDCISPVPEVIAGGGDDFETEGIPGSQVALGDLAGLAVDATGNVYVAERIQVNPMLTPFRHLSRVRKIEAEPPHRVTTVAGTLELDDGLEEPDEEVSLGTEARLSFPWEVSGLLQANGKLLFITDAMNNRVRALNIDPVETVVIGGLPIAPGEIATVMGGGPKAIHVQDKFALYTCQDHLPGGQVDWSEASSPGGELARSFQLRMPTGVSVADDALVVADTCTNRLLVMPLHADYDPELESSGVPPPWLPVSVLAGQPWQPGTQGPDGPVGLAGIERPIGLSYENETNHLWFGSWDGLETRLRRVRRMTPCEIATCDDSPGTVCEGEVIRSYATTGTCHEEGLYAYCTYEPIGEEVDCAEMGMACAGANGIARCVSPPMVVPEDEMIGRALSSNLIEKVVPPPGSVLSATDPVEIEIHFFEPIDVSSFSLPDDLVVTVERHGVEQSFEAAAVFAGHGWSQSGSTGCSPDTDVLTLALDTSLLLEGDILRFSFLGEDERGDQVITSAGDCPAGSGGEPVRLESRVSVRYTVAKAVAGVPGPPVVSLEPAGLVESAPDPIEPSGPDFVAPHDRLLTRFSEPLASVTVSASVLGGGVEDPVTFRAFRGLPDQLWDEEHTGLVRDVSAGLLPGQVYRFEIQAGEGDGLPGTVDLSGEPLAGDGLTEGTSYVRYLRTSHVRIALPRAEPFVPTDLRYDPFIKEGLMALQVTEHTRFIRPAGGIDFEEIDTSTLERPTRPVVSGVSLAPDGSGEVCVEAFSSSNESLGLDCMRVYDRLNMVHSAAIGPEGGALEVGHLQVKMGEEGTVIELEGEAVALPASLPRPTEVRISRAWPQGGDPSVFSIADDYHVGVPPELVLPRAALLWRRFDPDDPLLPDGLSDQSLGTRMDDGRFVGYGFQVMLPSSIGVAAPIFSTIQVRSLESEDWPICDPVLGAGTEEYGCCTEDHSAYLKPEDPECRCLYVGTPGQILGYADGVRDCEGNRVCCEPCEWGSPERPERVCSNPNNPGWANLSEEARETRCVSCLVNDCEQMPNQVVGRTYVPNPDDDGGRYVMRWGMGATLCRCRPPPKPTCSPGQDGEVCCSLQHHADGADCKVASARWEDPPQNCEQNATDYNQAIEDHEMEHVNSRRSHCEQAAALYNALAGRSFCAQDEESARDAAEGAGWEAMQPAVDASDRDQRRVEDEHEVKPSDYCPCP